MKKEICLVILLLSLLFYRGGHYWGFDQDEANEGLVETRIERSMNEIDQYETLRNEILADIHFYSYDGKCYYFSEDVEELISSILDYITQDMSESEYEDFRDGYLYHLPVYNTQDIVQKVIDRISD